MEQDAHATRSAAAARRVRAPRPEYFEVLEFLEDEAALLDDADLIGWLGLMADDLVYRMPVRVLPDLKGGSVFPGGMFHFDEDRATLELKVLRLATAPSAWANNPPQVSRHFVTNVRVHETDDAQEYEVSSSVLVARTRDDGLSPDLVTARRDDLVRREPAGLRLARRTIYTDQPTIPWANLAVFL